MKNIIKYNKLIETIVFDFVKRYYKEVYQEEAERNDFDIINYVGVSFWPVEISDMYLDINDILIAELYQIPCKIYRDYYNLCLDTEWNPWINLYNFFRKSCYPQSYEAEEKESLKQSKENVKKAKEELFNCLKK